MKKYSGLSDTLGITPLPSYSSDAIAALLWAREVLQNHLTTSNSAQGPDGVEELKAVKINGVDQWLHIRGRDSGNPVLLYLHGGPGDSLIGRLDTTFRPWEDYFTVVRWDQRQSGKSYHPDYQCKQPISVELMIEDAAEVVKYLCKYLRQSKIFLLGHSWGSVLGMHIVKRLPEHLYAYIGVGQLVNWMNNERTKYQRLLSHAKAQKIHPLISRLETMAPYPNPDCPAKSVVENDDFIVSELSRLAGEANMHRLKADDPANILAFDCFISPHFTVEHFVNRVLGYREFFDCPPYDFTNEYLRIDLPNDVGSSFDVPIVFFSGTHDWHTPTVLSDQWFDEISAPHKQLIHFKESCHYIVNEEPGKVLVALVNQVLPLAQQGE